MRYLSLATSGPTLPIAGPVDELAKESILVWDRNLDGSGSNRLVMLTEGSAGLFFRFRKTWGFKWQIPSIPLDQPLLIS